MYITSLYSFGIPGNRAASVGVPETKYSMFLDGKEYLVNSLLPLLGLTKRYAFSWANIISSFGEVEYTRDLVIPNLAKYSSKSFNQFTGSDGSLNSINAIFNTPQSENVEYYKKLLTTYFKHQGLVPNRGKEYYKFNVPALAKSSYDRLREQNVKSLLTYKLKDAFLAMEEDNDTFGDIQSELKTIPVLFEHNMNADDFSLDLTLSVIKYADMALTYQAQSELAPEADLLLGQVKSNSVVQTTSEGIVFNSD